MRAMPRRLSTWPPTRRMRTMPMVWRSSPRSGSFVRCGSRASTACSDAHWWRRGTGWCRSRPGSPTRSAGWCRNSGSWRRPARAAVSKPMSARSWLIRRDWPRSCFRSLKRGGLCACAAELGRQLVTSARRSEACQILMSVPGVGAVTATSFAIAVEDPENFRRSRSVGAWLGLTTRRYQSGEVDYDGHISRRGDTHLRGLLYEAATVLLTRTSAESSLRTWGLKLKERIGFKRAAVAVARKLAVVMHAMLRSGQLFDRTAGVAA